MSPPTNCLSPIGDELMRKGLVSFLNVIESEGDEDEGAQLDLDAAGDEARRREGSRRPPTRAKGAGTPARLGSGRRIDAAAAEERASRRSRATTTSSRP